MSDIKSKRIKRIAALMNEIKGEMDNDQNILAITVDGESVGGKNWLQVSSAIGISEYTDEPICEDVETQDNGDVRHEYFAYVDGVKVLDTHTDYVLQLAAQS